jgi:hypothetical protein
MPVDGSGLHLRIDNTYPPQPLVVFFVATSGRKIESTSSAMTAFGMGFRVINPSPKSPSYFDVERAARKSLLVFAAVAGRAYVLAGEFAVPDRVNLFSMPNSGGLAHEAIAYAEPCRAAVLHKVSN